MVRIKTFLVTILGFIISVNAEALVEWKCGEYRVVGQRVDNHFVLYPKSFSEFNFKKLLVAIKQEELAAHGITPTDFLTVRLRVQALDANGLPEKFSLISYIPTSYEDLRSKMSGPAVQLLSESACIAK